MKSFIQLVVDELINLDQRKLLIIVPTRRSGVLIKNAIASQLKKTAWLPTVVPIADLLQFVNPVPVADEYRQLFLLFEAYKNQEPETTIDDFLNWGSQVLDDFNEIDTNLINANDLFKRVADIKELDQLFAPDSEEINYLNQFWLQFSENPLSPLKEEFINYWTKLPQLYKDFNQLLNEENVAYDGKVWKDAAITVERNTWINSFSKVAFVGFYALMKSEERIVKSLQKTNKAIVFKDADEYYFSSKFQEAGLFFRKGILADKNTNWTFNYLLNDPKEIEVIGVTGRFSMARELAASVKNQLENLDPKERSQAVVVLPDDSLLFPFLTELSKTGINVNPSMGFPVAHHPFMHLLKSIRNHRIQLFEDPNTSSGYNLEQILIAHPIIVKAEYRNSSTKIWGEIVSINCTDIQNEAKLLIDFIVNFKEQEEPLFSGFYQNIYHETNKIINQLDIHKEVLTVRAWWKLVIDALNKIRIPFKSAEENSIHVMGFLETRVLDFKYVFIASLNEGTLPGNAIPKSLIPYSLRKAYQLPCKEEQDAVTAYHFYRLLQRAQFVKLFYNSELNDMGGGEKSRYLLQLQYELSRLNPKINIQYKQVNPVPEAPSKVSINIQKSNEVLQLLKDKYIVDAEEEIRGKGFSASSLAVYISCSLKFYFENIAGLKITEKSNEIDALMFGKIFHKCMELIYHSEQEIDFDYIENRKEEIAEFVNKAIETEFGNNTLTGNNLLMRKVIEELAINVLINDQTLVPFKVESIEKEFKLNVQIPEVGSVLLKGFFDRIDLKDDCYSILDYKTGKDSTELPKNFEDIFSEPEYRVSFQLMFYEYLFRRLNPNVAIKSGIYKLRKSIDGIQYLNDGKPIENANWDIFNFKIEKLIEEIFNSDIPFSQTNEINNCRNCDFKGICNRLN
jgi:hypothetical protein